MENQRPLLGFALALLAAMTWGMLPIAVRQVLKFVDAPTLVWVRFTVAAAVLFVLLALGGRLPKRRDFSWHSFRLLLLGVTGISANFVLIAQGLHYISPTTTQVLWQISPFTMIVVGVLVFKDRMTAAQKIGLVLLLVGLLMFFNDKFGELSGLGAYAKGVLLCAAGSMAWVC
ncbi:DMT family transporter, partial [Neisseria gonorrhoeae]